MFLFFKHSRTIFEFGLLFALVAKTFFLFTDSSKGSTTTSLLIIFVGCLLMVDTMYVSKCIMPFRRTSISINTPIEFIDTGLSSNKVVWKFNGETISAPREKCVFITVTEDPTNNTTDHPALPYCEECRTETSQTIFAFGRIIHGQETLHQTYNFYISDQLAIK